MAVSSFNEIRSLYEKHGWVLRRVQASPALMQELAGLGEAVLLAPSDLDTAWFSRPPQPGPVPWELRYLGEPPFALVQSFDEADPEFEQGLMEMDSRLREAVAGKA